MKTRILVIDAEPGPIEALRNVLDENFELMSADNGAQGENLAREEPPAAVVLSADVPNGFAHCRRFKKDATLSRIPLILTSSELEQETLDKHSRLPTRADAYLKKPFAGETLLTLIAELLARPVEAKAEPDESDTMPPGSEENQELQDAMRRLEYDQAEQTDRLDDAINALRSSETRVDELRDRLINESEGRESAETVASQYLDVLQTQGEALEKAEAREASATGLLEKERSSSQRLIDDISRRENSATDRLQEMRARITHLESSIEIESTERQAHADELEVLTAERTRREKEAATLRVSLENAEHKETTLAKRRAELEAMLQQELQQIKTLEESRQELLEERDNLLATCADLQGNLQKSRTDSEASATNLATLRSELATAHELAVELDAVLVAERQKNAEAAVQIAQLTAALADAETAMATSVSRHEEHIRIQREEHVAEQQRARGGFESALLKSNSEHAALTESLKVQQTEALTEMQTQSERAAETNAATQATLERAVAEAHESRGRLQAEMKAAHETATAMESQLKQTREHAERQQAQLNAVEEELDRTRDAGEVLLQDLANAQARQATFDSQMTEAREKAAHFEATADQSARQLERKDMELRSLEQKFEILGMRFAQAEEIQHLQNQRIQQVAGMLQNAAIALAGDPGAPTERSQQAPKIPEDARKSTPEDSES